MKGSAQCLASCRQSGTLDSLACLFLPGVSYTEDEMAGWHHQLNGHEFEQTPGDGEGQGSLACCSPWGHKELDTTERLNNSKDVGPDHIPDEAPSQINAYSFLIKCSNPRTSYIHASAVKLQNRIKNIPERDKASFSHLPSLNDYCSFLLSLFGHKNNSEWWRQGVSMLLVIHSFIHSLRDFLMWIIF